MKKIDLFDKYTTPESWKDAVRSGVREKTEKRKVGISFLPSLQTVLAVIAICAIVGFVVSGGLVNLIDTSNTSGEGDGFKPNAGNVGNNANNTVASENMTEEEMIYAYKAYSEAFGFEETEAGYESFVKEMTEEPLGDRKVVVFCGADNARCKKTNAVFVHGSSRSLVGNNEYDECMVIIVPIVFDNKVSINADDYNGVYKLYSNVGILGKSGYTLDCEMQVEYKAYDEFPGVLYAVCIIEPTDEIITSQGEGYLREFIERERTVSLEFIAGNFADEEITQIYNYGTDLTCSCSPDNCEHFKLKGNDRFIFGVSFVNPVTEK